MQDVIDRMSPDQLKDVARSKEYRMKQLIRFAAMFPNITREQLTKASQLAHQELELQSTKHELERNIRNLRNELSSLL